MGIRKLMDFIFSPIEMYWLDHMLPGEDRIKREDELVNEYRYEFISCFISLIFIYIRMHPVEAHRPVVTYKNLQFPHSEKFGVG